MNFQKPLVKNARKQHDIAIYHYIAILREVFAAMIAFFMSSYFVVKYFLQLLFISRVMTSFPWGVSNQKSRNKNNPSGFYLRIIWGQMQAYAGLLFYTNLNYSAALKYYFWDYIPQWSCKIIVKNDSTAFTSASRYHTRAVSIIANNGLLVYFLLFLSSPFWRSLSIYF